MHRFTDLIARTDKKAVVFSVERWYRKRERERERVKIVFS
ncbi:hypothetical protein HPHPP4C_0977 [Helicobacter pylori Hp P-4c]|nr:hypothetical protein HPHPP4C_0977 [Helicobacter pylori Hp P-4c]